MDAITGVGVAKTAVDLVKTDNVLNKTAGIMGMLFPYAGLKQKAVNMYIEDIEKSDMSPETKVFTVLNIKKTFKRIKNQKAVADIAIENAKEGTDFSEKSGVSEEWLDRFMDSAGFVSSDELQIVWGKILANEFERPGTTPPNMIRVLSEITPDMARAFRSICSMTVTILPLDEEGNIECEFRKLFVPYKRNEDKLHELGLNFNILNELDTLGVLKFNSIGGYVAKGIANKKVLFCIGDKIELVEEHKQESVPTGNILLTSVGEALQLITDPIDIVDYHEMVKNYLISGSVKLSDSHDYDTKVEDNTLNIYRKNCD